MINHLYFLIKLPIPYITTTKYFGCSFCFLLSEIGLQIVDGGLKLNHFLLRIIHTNLPLGKKKKKKKKT